MIAIIVALSAEARPLIQHYRLRSVTQISGFRAYANDRIFLLQSGMGKAMAAAAVAFAQGWHSACPAANPLAPIRCWLNVGIAGHRSFALGECVIAHKLTDQGSGQHWYPAFVSQQSQLCKSAALTTVDVPQQTYPDETVYDMEATGFFAAANRFASTELISVIKVISDNQENTLSVSDATKNRVEQLLYSALPIIDNVLDRQLALAHEAASIDADPPFFREILSHFHVTQSQRHRLRRILQRFNGLGYSDEQFPQLSEFKNLKALLSWLEQCLGAGMAHYRLD